MRTWTTPVGLGFEDEQTGDGRLFVAGAFTWEDPDGNGWPLRYAPEDNGFHQGAMLVGAIGELSRDGTAIRGNGSLDDEDDGPGADAARRLDDGQPLGVSLDLDDVEFEVVATQSDDDAEDVVLLAAAVPHMTVTFDQAGALVACAAPGLHALLAAGGLVAAAGDGDPEDGVVIFADASDSVIWRFTRARIRGATLVDIGAFDRAAIVLDPAGGAADDGDSDGADADAGDEGDALAAAGTGCIPCLVAAAVQAPVDPPRSFFADPGLSRLTPLTYTDDGHVFGHIAGWGQCHTGSDGSTCVLTPRSPSGYQYMHLGSLVTAEGDTIAVGPLTMGGGHADPRLSFRAALAHYDNVANRVADVRAGEDAYGVWVAGALRPDVAADPERMRALRAAPPSGDWRLIGGAHELMLAHSINVPGFPVPQVGLAASGQVLSIVAAGARAVAQVADPDTPMAVLSADVIEAAVDLALTRFMDRQEEVQRRVALSRLRRQDPVRAAALTALRGRG